MIATILVPLDGSSFAETALPSARWIASRTGAHLHLFLAHQPVPVFVGVGEALAGAALLDTESLDQERGYLVDTANRLGLVGGGPVEISVGGAPAGAEIVEAAARIGADLIVMATHGRGALGRLWLGSVADHVVRHASVPLLLIRPPEPDTPGGQPEIRGILAPLDLSAVSRTILAPVVEFARLAKAPVTLLYVVERFFQTFEPGVPYPIPQDPGIAELQRANAEHLLEEAASVLRERGVVVSTRVVIATHAAAGVLDTLAEPGHDLVALATHGAGGIRRLLLGSVADQVIRGASKRVLVVRPPDELQG
jgi:nucleotide-binding universal stress UspA family protein